MASASRVAALALVGGLGLAACGVGVQNQPQDLPAASVPYGLLRAAPLPSPSAAAAQVRAVVYLVRGSKIVRATALVPAPARIDQVVRTLLNGVTATQSAAGLRSAIPDGTHLLSLDLSGRVATLDLSTQFASARSADTILAVAQLVLTTTASSEVSAVRFSVNGRLIEVPSPGGALAYGPVTGAEYQTLVSR